MYEAEKADVDAAVEAAEAAFKTWSKVPGSERGKLLWKLADIMERNMQVSYDGTARTKNDVAELPPLCIRCSVTWSLSTMAQSKLSDTTSRVVPPLASATLPAGPTRFTER